MGDRTWTGISFSGVINVEQAKELVEELKAQSCKCDDGPGGELSIEHLKLDTCFYDEDCNYATMEGVEAWCAENGVSYLKTWSPGGGYGEGADLHIGLLNETLSFPTSESEVTLSATSLKEFLKQGKTLADVVKFVEHVDKFRESYPPLVVQP